MVTPRGTQAGAVLDRFLQAATVLAVLAMMLYIVANALSRRLADTPITGTHEIVANWLLPVVVLLGIYLAQRRQDHIEARVIFDHFPRASRVDFQVVGQTLTACLCLGFASFGFTEALHAYSIGLTEGFNGVAIWPIMFLVPISFLLLTVQLIVDTVTVVRHKNPELVRADSAASNGKAVTE